MLPSRVSVLAALVVNVIALALVGCGGNQSGGPVDAETWPCPAEWVPYAKGGCGPAVLLCAADGGAAEGACTGVDITQSHTVTSADGGAGTSFWRDPSGSVRGGWPADDFAPDAGYHTCPSGWVTEGDTCSPALRTDCPAGSAAYPGGQCTHTASADCPATAYADPGAEATGATVVHVQAGAASAGADGSEAHPFPTIAQGAAAAGAGGWVLLAAGSYPEAVATAGELHVMGPCAANVTLALPAGATGATASGAGAHLDVRGLTLSGGGTGAIAASGGRVSLRGVVVSGAAGMGVRAGGVGSAVDGTDVWVRDTMDLGDGASGWGALAEGGASVTLAQSVLSGSKQIGAAALGAGSSITLTDAVVSGTAAVARGGDGGGLHAQDGGVITATRAVLVANANVNAGALGTGSRVGLTDAVVRDGVARADGTFGRGLHAQSGASIDATRVRLDGNAEVGASALGAGTVLTLTDATVSNTRTSGAGAAGRGLYVQDGARLEAHGTVVEGNRDLGAGAFGAGTVAVLADSTVRGTRAAMDATQGGGLQAQNGATLSATRVLVDDNQAAGVTALDHGTTVSLEDSVVRATAARADGTFGRGALAQGGASLTLARVLVADNHEFGVLGHGMGTAVVVTDSDVRGTLPDAMGASGRGVQAERGASLAAERVLLEQNAELGLAAWQPGSSATLADVIVLGTVSSGRGLGGGVGALGGGSVASARLAVQDVRGVGVGAMVSNDPSLGTFYNAVLTDIDLFVRGVSPAPTRFTDMLPTTEAYGLYAGESTTLDVTCAVVDDGRYGYVDDRATALGAHRALFSAQSQAAGATTAGTANGTLMLEHIVYQGNGGDSTQNGASLPSAY